MSWPSHTLETLKARVEVNEQGCWIWKGHVGKNGYGQVSHENKPDRPHRVFYRLHKGEIPEGKEIDHLCRVKSCVNPDHLEAVTHQVNAKRGHDANPYNLN